MIYPELSQPVSLDHLKRMTDCFGLIQHANYSLPDLRSGYTTDDNARAYEADGDVSHLRRAQDAREWSFGRTLAGVSLYDPETGGCFDALMEGGVNRNRGAESTVCLVPARLVMLEARQRLADKLLAGPAGEEPGPLANADYS